MNNGKEKYHLLPSETASEKTKFTFNNISGYCNYRGGANAINEFLNRDLLYVKSKEQPEFVKGRKK